MGAVKIIRGPRWIVPEIVVKPFREPLAGFALLGLFVDAGASLAGNFFSVDNHRDPSDLDGIAAEKKSTAGIPGTVVLCYFVGDVKFYSHPRHCL